MRVYVVEEEKEFELTDTYQEFREDMEFTIRDEGVSRRVRVIGIDVILQKEGQQADTIKKLYVERV